MKYYTDKGRDGQDKQEKTCCKTQHVKIDTERDASIIICRMAAVGENYNSTRDILMILYDIICKARGKKSYGTWAIGFCLLLIPIFVIGVAFLICGIFMGK